MKLKLEIIGNLGADATIKEVNNSKAISFSVAHSEKYKNQQGEQVEKTTWVNCTQWKYKDQSTEIVKYLKKGTMVAIEGTPSVNGYQNQQGEIGASLNCRVTDLRLLSVPKTNNDEVIDKKEKSIIKTDGDNDGFPF